MWKKEKGRGGKDFHEFSQHMQIRFLMKMESEKKKEKQELKSPPLRLYSLSFLPVRLCSFSCVSSLIFQRFFVHFQVRPCSFYWYVHAHILVCDYSFVFVSFIYHYHCYMLMEQAHFTIKHKNAHAVKPSLPHVGYVIVHWPMSQFLNMRTGLRKFLGFVNYCAKKNCLGLYVDVMITG